MPGYLDQYGAGEERRNRIIARTIIGTLTVVIVVALSWYLLKNHHEEGQVKTFIAAIRSGDYQAAYRAWGCTSEKPCRTYSYKNMMEDWGATTSAPDPAVFGILDSESCNNGVLISVAVNKGRTETLWVDKNQDGIGFAPYPVCPAKNPFAIMLHRTVGQLRKPLLR
jgi:hypothetical protein